MQNEAYVIVSPDYPPHSGGVERYSYYVAGELRKRGYPVIVISSSMEGEPEMETDLRGVEVWRFPSIWPIRDRMPVVLPTGRWKELKQVLKDYDTVRFIVQTNLYYLSLKGVMFAQQNGYRSVMIVHGSNYVCLGNGLVDRCEHFYERWIAERAGKYGAEFAAVSKASAEYAQEKLKCKIKSIAYNAIDFAEIEEIRPDEKSSLREMCKLPENTVIFTFVGRLIREKGVPQLTEAFEKLRKEYGNTALIIIGAGQLQQEIENRKIENLFVLGQQPHEEVIKILKQSDCFILPSDSEGFPTTILEAAACGADIIATPFGGTREAVEITGGTLLEDNSENEILRACRDYLSKRHGGHSPGSMEQLKSIASWEKTVDTIIQSFR